MKYYLCTFNTFNMHLFSLDFNTLNIMFQVSILQNSKIFFYVHNQNSSLENMVKVYYKTNKRDKKGKNRSSRVSVLVGSNVKELIASFSSNTISSFPDNMNKINQLKSALRLKIVTKLISHGTYLKMLYLLFVLFLPKKHCYIIYSRISHWQKQPSRSVLRKRCSEKTKQI